MICWLMLLSVAAIVLLKFVREARNAAGPDYLFRGLRGPQNGH